MKFLAIAFVILMTVQSARAQTESSGGGSNSDDFSLFGGYLLPNQIERVTEILPVFGGRYAFSLPAGALELEVGNSHAWGVDFTTFSVNLRGEIPLGAGISGLIYGGPDYHYYLPEGATTRAADFGIHMGVGGLLLVSDSLWLRTDLKLAGNPGTMLYILFGLMFRTPGGS